MITLKLDDDKEWLVRNALQCYREAATKGRIEANRDAAQAAPEFKPSYEHLARSWEGTIKRIDALVNELDEKEEAA